MSPIETLQQEHQVIEQVLGAAEKESRRTESTGKVNVECLERIVDFIWGFVECTHQAKEENLLFRRMNERGVPIEMGLLAVILGEHERGRSLIRQITDCLVDDRAGESLAAALIKDNLGQYVELIRGNIQKEETVLYPMADRLLRPEDQQALTKAFERLEQEEKEQGTYEKYRALAHELAGIAQ